MRWQGRGRPSIFPAIALVAHSPLSPPLFGTANLTQSRTATFGAPHAGNAEFAAAYSEAPITRVTRGGDPVPDLPAPVSAVSRLNYTHVGTPLVLPGQSEPRPGNRLTIRQWRDALERRDPPAFLADHAPSGYVQALAEA